MHRTVDGERLYGPYASEEQAQEKINYVTTGQSEPQTVKSDVIEIPESPLEQYKRLAMQKSTWLGIVTAAAGVLGVQTGTWVDYAAAAIASVVGLGMVVVQERNNESTKE